MISLRLFAWWAGFVVYIVVLVLSLISILYEYAGARHRDRSLLYLILLVFMSAVVVVGHMLRLAWLALHA